ncbi:MAG: ORF6N domain-containing protein [Chitinivibrionales bacterium]|nr:ORF6N domain-containing protein [Chitinivibrionales bacterium]MBD3396187.1 ORF6N domain-containing protein [Chitinivibrionales bacterium]
MTTKIVPVEVITEKIFEIHGQKVMLDAELAKLYGVSNKALNQAVKRNRQRFPADFMFQLSRRERDELVTKCDRLTKLKHSSVMPHAFTEAGVAMLSSVLNSEKAVQVNVQIIRAFIKLRTMLSEHEALRHAIQGLEGRVSRNERNIQIAINTLQKLIAPPKLPQKRHKMGFGPPTKKK